MVINSYLETIRGLRKQMATELTEFIYYGNEDFLLQHGRYYTPKPFPDSMWRGAPRACFGNAILVAAVYGLTYVEGYALNECRLPIHHAWNADADGNVLDCTWLQYPGSEFFGVEFSVERADDATWNGDASVLDDWKRGFPLFKSPWNGEDYSITWPQSDRLDGLRKTAAAIRRASPLPDSYRVVPRCH